MFLSCHTYLRYLLSFETLDLSGLTHTDCVLRFAAGFSNFAITRDRSGGVGSEEEENVNLSTRPATTRLDRPDFQAHGL